MAERKNHTLTDLVNAMLDTAGLSKEWWGEAILTACHVLNRVPTKNKEKVYITPSPMGVGLHNLPTYETIYITPELSKTGQITP